MLKRIAVVDGESLPIEQLTAALAGDEVDVAAHRSGEPLPPGATAALPNQAGSEPLAPLALELAGRHTAMLELLADAVDCREGFLAGSSRRVCAHASRFAEALGLPPDDRATLERGALLRDLGKIRIPNTVLLKSGPLTFDEWDSLRQHTVKGSELAAQTPGLEDIADILLRHHECYDGDGYPGRLEKDAIPYLARIVKIIDVFCAMTSPRHYRISHADASEAIEHIQSERGKHFDPGLVDVFLEHRIGQPWEASKLAEPQG